MALSCGQFSEIPVSEIPTLDHDRKSVIKTKSTSFTLMHVGGLAVIHQ